LSIAPEVKKEFTTVTGKKADFEHPSIGDAIVLSAGIIEQGPWEFGAILVYLGESDAFPSGWAMDLDFGSSGIRLPLPVFRGLKDVVKPVYGGDKTTDISMFTMDHLEMHFSKTMDGRPINWENPKEGDVVQLITGILPVSEWELTIYLRYHKKTKENPLGWVVDVTLGFYKVHMPLHVFRIARDLIIDIKV
jgi:hypothetical protein